MRLSPFSKRKETTSPSAPDGGDEVRRLRARSRQRLVGAAVLIAVGVIGFPLVFETQPRPIAIDIPIEIAHKDQVPPLVMPPPRAPAVAAQASAPAAKLEPAVPKAAPKPTAETSTAPLPKASPPSTKAAPLASPPAPKPTSSAVKPAPAPEKPGAQAAKPARGDDSRARALLEGKEARSADTVIAAAGARFVVQVGAFSEEAAARDMRQKVEKLGMKTHTQKVATQAGSRIRVRVGPFTSRDEADRVAARLESSGVSSAVLGL